jgi:hypothetical protein
MKIGLSYSRCIRDIVDGTVDPKDVLIIISRTSFDPHHEDQWKMIWEGYRGRGSFNSPREWAHYDADREQEFRDVTLNLWADGKLHQPRNFGAYPRRLPYYWLETIVSADEMESSPAIKDAWEKFQMVSGLKGTTLHSHRE